MAKKPKNYMNFLISEKLRVIKANADDIESALTDGDLGSSIGYINEIHKISVDLMTEFYLYLGKHQERLKK
jgi:hypothetical protein